MSAVEVAPPGRSTCEKEGDRSQQSAVDVGNGACSSVQVVDSPDGLELIGKVLATGVGTAQAKERNTVSQCSSIRFKWAGRPVGVWPFGSGAGGPHA